MASFNKVILAGNLTRDPELRYTPKGTAIARITLAVNRSWKTETGETREEVSFVDIDAFARQAEVIGQYLKKGRPLLVEGRLRQETWEDKTSHQKKSKLMVVLESFSFLDSRPEGAGESYRKPAAAAPVAASAAPEEMSAEPPSEDDVPF